MFQYYKEVTMKTYITLAALILSANATANSVDYWGEYISFDEENYEEVSISPNQANYLAFDEEQYRTDSLYSYMDVYDDTVYVVD
mgnify:FL=1|jgi:hypothetical protein